MPTGSFLTQLRSLTDHQVDFIVVGGVAAVLNGAPLNTFDLDVVYSLEPPNSDRVLNALESLDACFRLQPERQLRPNRSHFAAGGHMNLLTRFGPLDLLGTIGHDLDYADLLPQSIEMQIAPDVRIRVLQLETIISLKEQLGLEKDLAALPLLRRTLALKKKTKPRNSS